MIPVFIALWVLAQLTTNALMCLAFEPKGSLVLPLVSVLAGNMILTVIGWELSHGRALVSGTLKRKRATPKPAPMPSVLFVKLEHDERGEWFSAWHGLANLLGSGGADVDAQTVGVYRLRSVKPVGHIVKALAP